MTKKYFIILITLFFIFNNSYTASLASLGAVSEEAFTSSTGVPGGFVGSSASSEASFIGSIAGGDASLFSGTVLAAGGALAIVSPWFLPVAVAFEIVPVVILATGAILGITGVLSSLTPSVPASSSTPITSSVSGSYLPSVTVPFSSLGDIRLSFSPITSSQESGENGNDSLGSLTNSLNEISFNINETITNSFNNTFTSITDSITNISTDFTNSVNNSSVDSF